MTFPKNIPREIIVVDNGCHDNTANVAKNLGAKVMLEPLKGYGSACLRGISVLKKDTDIVVFLDADYSDYPQDIHTILKPILTGKAEMVIGSRMLGVREKGALLPQAIFGNKLAAFLIRLFWGFRYTDLGPFRAIRYKALLALNMADKNFGWTVEMQIKALKKGLQDFGSSCKVSKAHWKVKNYRYFFRNNAVRVYENYLYHLQVWVS